MEQQERQEQREQQEPELGYTEVFGEHASNPSVSRTTGDVIFALGQEWMVSSCENRIKGQFEQWVRRKAKEAISIEEQEGNITEAESMRSTYLGDFSAGYYHWDGKCCRKALMEIPGFRHLLYLLMRRCKGQENIDENTVAEISKANPKGCGLAIKWALGNSQPPVTEPGRNGNQLSGKTGQNTQIDLAPRQDITQDEWDWIRSMRKEKKNKNKEEG